MPDHDPMLAPYAAWLEDLELGQAEAPMPIPEPEATRIERPGSRPATAPRWCDGNPPRLCDRGCGPGEACAAGTTPQRPQASFWCRLCGRTSCEGIHEAPAPERADQEATPAAAPDRSSAQDVFPGRSVLPAGPAGSHSLPTFAEVHGLEDWLRTGERPPRYYPPDPRGLADAGLRVRHPPRCSARVGSWWCVLAPGHDGECAPGAAERELPVSDFGPRRGR